MVGFSGERRPPAGVGVFAPVEIEEGFPKRPGDPPANCVVDCDVTLLLDGGRAMLAKGFLDCGCSCVEVADAGNEEVAGGRAIDVKGLDLVVCSGAFDAGD